LVRVVGEEEVEEVAVRDAAGVQVKDKAAVEAAATKPAPVRAATAFAQNAGTKSRISLDSVVLTALAPSAEQR
jgi:hypothetical protein